jgi:hypothetical protein
MAATNEQVLRLTDEQRQELEALLVALDRCWHEGRLAECARALPTASPLRLPALIEMVKIDLERQWQTGRRVSLQGYLDAYPELGSAHTVALDLIQAEYEVRLQFGDLATVEDYARRFPGRAAAVRQALRQASQDETARAAFLDGGAKRAAPADVAAEATEGCARRLALLGEHELRQIAGWKLEGHSNEEIAARLGCALSTVERKWKRIRDLWKQEGLR